MWLHSFCGFARFHVCDGIDCDHDSRPHRSYASAAARWHGFRNNIAAHHLATSAPVRSASHWNCGFCVERIPLTARDITEKRSVVVSSKRLLFIVAHPDDAAISAGGLIASTVGAGGEVHVINVTSGGRGCYGVAPAKAVVIREREEMHAAAILGYVPEFLKFQDGSVPFNSEALYKRLRCRIAEFMPSFVFTHAPGDLHSDHAAVGHVTRKLAYDMRKAAARSDPFTLYGLLDCFDLRDPLRSPLVFVGVGRVAATVKRRALAVYRSQLRANDFLTAEFHRMRCYGTFCRRQYAEAYVPHFPNVAHPEPILLSTFPRVLP
ncbi:MAG: PIG-L family deacetylase [Bryobacteraceae bacterium]|nr:PIG-L family deacetylase [Bryobacteraceae bacterium]